MLDHAPDHPADRSTGPDAGKLAAVADLGDTLARLSRALHRAKTRAMSRGGDGGTEWGSRIVLARVVAEGPRRVTDLAEATGVDASTVSRQVAAMVKEGLLAREADPADGRASLVVATDRGRDVMDEMRGARNREFARLLEGWAADDCATLARLLDRFVTDIDLYHPDGDTPDAAGREENPS